MRKFFLVAAITLVAAAGSAIAQSDNDKPKIEGSGNMITRDVSIKSFDELEANGVFNVVLEQGGGESLKIEADDNLQELFEVKNDGNRLVIGMKKGVDFRSKKKLTVYIVFKKLKEMDLKTIGGVSSKSSLSFDDLKINNKSVGGLDLSLTVNTLKIDNKSVGGIKLTGKADKAIINNKGVGGFEASAFVVQEMEIENAGVGSAEVNAVKALKVKDTFLNKVKNTGAATAKRVNTERI